jgi:hypothetical protein
VKVASLFAALSLRPDTGSFKKSSRLITGVKAALVGLVGIKTAQYFKRMFTDVAATADRYHKLAQRVGASSEALQQLDFAAKIGGADIQSLTKAMLRLSRGATDAKNAAGPARDMFKSLGIVATDAAGGLRPVDEMLMDVADRFKAMPDGAEKTALAFKLLGRAGPQLIPFLNAGRDGIDKLRKEFVALGGQIDTETVEKFAELKDNMLRVEVATQGVKNQIAIALLPTILETSKRVVAWVKANNELLRAKVKEYVDKVVTAARAAFRIFLRVAGVVRDVTNAFGGARRMVKILIGTWVAMKAIGIVAFLAKITTALYAVATAGGVARGATAGLGAGVGGLGLLAKGGLVAGAAGAGLLTGHLLDKQFGISDEVSSFLSNGGRERVLEQVSPSRIRAAARSVEQNIDARATISTTIHAAPGMDERELEDKVTHATRREFERQTRKLQADLLPDL